MPWTIELRGGSYDGWVGDLDVELEPVLVAWYCGECGRCEGHATFDVAEPRIIFSRAQAYNRAEVDEKAHAAVYDVGDVLPGDEAEVDECVLVGASLERMADYEADALGVARGTVYALAFSLVAWMFVAVPFVLTGGGGL